MSDSKKQAAAELAEEYLNAYDANDDDRSMQALRDRLGIKNEEHSVLAGMLLRFAEQH